MFAVLFIAGRQVVLKMIESFLIIFATNSAAHFLPPRFLPSLFQVSAFFSAAGRFYHSGVYHGFEQDMGPRLADAK